MAQLLPDSMDFSEYMDDTDTAHRVRSSGDYLQQVIDYFHGPEGNRGASLPWGKASGKLGFRPGETTLWGGFNGSGKSLVLGQACVHFCRTGQRVVIASMEMRPMLTLSRMCRQEYGRSPTLDAIGQFHKWTDPVLWLYDQLGAVRNDKMLAVLRYCADKLKADHFVIDSLMKCGIGEDDYNAQKNFLDHLCTIGRDTGMHIHLVAHSRKQKDENTAPGKMDIKGTGTMTDQVDNVITVWRNKKQEESERAGMVGNDPDCLLICDKQRNGEWEGKIGLFFDPETSSYGEQKRRGSF